MEMQRYKYDVAFSFLAQDEVLATQLNDLLQDRVQTFLYSKKQGEIAGTDGEKSFNQVFGEQSRLVVVLYRDGWGETPWTRIEETSIRNRAYEEGYDFVIFIPLGDTPTPPKWLPKTQLWVGLKRWGVTGAASVIEARIQELGGEPHQETVEARAARLERSLKFAEKRKQFLGSEIGVAAASKEFEALQNEIERSIVSIKNTAASLPLKTKKTQHQLIILGLNVGLSVNWRCYYANSLDGSRLDVTLWDGHPPFPGVMHIEEPKKLQNIHFISDFLVSEEYGWISSDSKRRIFSTKNLASFILKHYMDQAHVTELM